MAVADHSEALVELVKDAAFIEHFAAVSVLVVVGDAQAQLTGQLATHDVFLHLLTLHATTHDNPLTHARQHVVHSAY